jgi:hypothetical protein
VADPVCIIRERNHQVQQIGQIYSNALEVVVWFGPDIDSRSLALDFLQANASGRRKPLASKDIDKSKHDLAGRICNALVALCCDEYWNPTWIIQEVLLAPRLHLMSGNVKVDWSTLVTFLDDSPISSSLLLRPENFGEEPHSKFWNSRARLLCLERARSMGRMHGYSLEDLLAKFGNSKCSDVRDRVLGLPPLADYGKNGNFKVNYRMDKWTLFEYFVSFCTRSPIKDARILVRTLNISPADIRRIFQAPTMQIHVTSVSKLINSMMMNGPLSEGPVCCYCKKTLTIIVKHGSQHSIEDFPRLFPDSVMEPNEGLLYREHFPQLASRGPMIIGDVGCVDSESTEGHFLFDRNRCFGGFVLGRDNILSNVDTEKLQRKESFMIDTELIHEGTARWLKLTSTSFISLLGGDTADYLLSSTLSDTKIHFLEHYAHWTLLPSLSLISTASGAGPLTF